MRLNSDVVRLMELKSIQPGCWPTENQELLLKACLFEGDPAIAAWETWRSRVDIDWIDEGSHRLLPLLYYNIKRLGIDDPMLGKIRGVYLYMLSKTHLMMHRVGPLLFDLQQNGIEVILLKGAALAIAHYENLALRPSLDIDVLVKREHAERAFNRLLEHHWRPEYSFPVNDVLVHRHSCGFEAGAERRLDLHWNVFIEGRSPGIDEVFWEESVPLQFRGLSLRTLSPTHHVLHNVAHGLRWNTHAPCRWVADVMTIIRSSGKSVSWNALFKLAKERHVLKPVGEGLHYLKDNFGAAVPDANLAQFRHTKIPLLDQYAYRIHTRDKGRFSGNFLKFTMDYLRFAEPRGFLRKLLAFPRYLQINWKVESLLLMPILLVRESIRARRKQINEQRQFIPSQ